MSRAATNKESIYSLISTNIYNIKTIVELEGSKIATLEDFDPHEISKEESEAIRDYLDAQGYLVDKSFLNIPPDSQNFSLNFNNVQGLENLVGYENQVVNYLKDIYKYIPENWQVIKYYDDKVTGFQGAAYKYTGTSNSDFNNGDVIFACRGTEPEKPNLEDFVGDNMNLISAMEPQQAEIALSKYNDLINDLNVINFDGNISITGHSLGGGLAQWIAYKKGQTSVTFNAAGIGHIIDKQDFGKHYDNITNYVVDTDFVTSAFTQIGNTYYIKNNNSSGNTVPLKKITLNSWFENISKSYLIDYEASLGFHFMDSHIMKDNFVDSNGNVIFEVLDPGEESYTSFYKSLQAITTDVRESIYGTHDGSMKNFLLKKGLSSSEVESFCHLLFGKQVLVVLSDMIGKSVEYLITFAKDADKLLELILNKPVPETLKNLMLAPKTDHLYMPKDEIFIRFKESDTLNRYFLFDADSISAVDANSIRGYIVEYKNVTIDCTSDNIVLTKHDKSVVDVKPIVEYFGKKYPDFTLTYKFIDENNKEHFGFAQEEYIAQKEENHAFTSNVENTVTVKQGDTLGSIVTAYNNEHGTNYSIRDLIKSNNLENRTTYYMQDGKEFVNVLLFPESTDENGQVVSGDTIAFYQPKQDEGSQDSEAAQVVENEKSKGAFEIPDQSTKIAELQDHTDFTIPKIDMDFSYNPNPWNIQLPTGTGPLNLTGLGISLTLEELGISSWDQLDWFNFDGYLDNLKNTNQVKFDQLNLPGLNTDINLKLTWGGLQLGGLGTIGLDKLAGVDIGDITDVFKDIKALDFGLGVNNVLNFNNAGIPDCNLPVGIGKEGDFGVVSVGDLHLDFSQVLEDVYSNSLKGLFKGTPIADCSLKDICLFFDDPVAAVANLGADMLKDAAVDTLSKSIPGLNVVENVVDIVNGDNPVEAVATLALNALTGGMFSIALACFSFISSLFGDGGKKMRSNARKSARNSVYTIISTLEANEDIKKILRDNDNDPNTPETSFEFNSEEVGKALSIAQQYVSSSSSKKVKRQVEQGVREAQEYLMYVIRDYSFTKEMTTALTNYMKDGGVVEDTINAVIKRTQDGVIVFEDGIDPEQAYKDYIAQVDEFIRIYEARHIKMILDPEENIDTDYIKRYLLDGLINMKKYMYDKGYDMDPSVYDNNVAILQDESNWSTITLTDDYFMDIRALDEFLITCFNTEIDFEKLAGIISPSSIGKSVQDHLDDFIDLEHHNSDIRFITKEFFSKQLDDFRVKHQEETGFTFSDSLFNNVKNKYLAGDYHFWGNTDFELTLEKFKTEFNEAIGELTRDIPVGNTGFYDETLATAFNNLLDEILSKPVYVQGFDTNTEAYGGNLNDTILDDKGDDSFHSRGGDDKVKTGVGNDYLYDTGGNDSIDMGTGNDRLIDIAGNDSINMGGGFIKPAQNYFEVQLDNMYEILIDGPLLNEEYFHELFEEDLVYIKNKYLDNTYSLWTDVNIKTNFSLIKEHVSLAISEYENLCHDSVPVSGGFYSIVHAWINSQLTIFEEDFKARFESEFNPCFIDNDEVSDFSGNDHIFTGVGDDIISDHAGNDYIFTGKDKDEIAESDYNNNPTETANDGNDLVKDYGGDDHIYTGSGDDIVYDKDGSDYIYLGTGDDMVKDTDETGTDYIYGGTGNDTIETGLGIDFIYGEEDHDIIIDAGGNDTINTGDGNDIVYDDESVAPRVITIAPEEEDLITDIGGIDYIVVEEGSEATSDEGVAPQVATESDPVVNAGNDTIITGAGDDIVYTYGSGEDSIHTGSGDDNVYDYGGNDKDVVLGDGDDFIYDESGDDEIITYENEFSDAFAQDTVIDISGNDIIKTGSGDDIVEDHDGNDHIYTGSGEDKVRDFKGDDYYELGDDRDILEDDQGNDVIYAGDGHDSIWDKEGDDLIDLGSGNDVLQDDQGNDTIFGGAGDDFIYAGTGNDEISDESGVDTIYGGDGNDDIYEYGTEGDKIYAGAGHDNVYDYGGADLIDLGSGDDILYDYGTDNDLVFGGYGDDSIHLQGGNNEVTDDSGSDTIITGDGNDLITDYGDWFSEVDTIISGAGNDHVYDYGGDDFISLGSGDDILYDHGGDDTINSGAGNDRINDKEGDDTYLFAAGDGQDSLNDDGGNDTISFASNVNKDDIALFMEEDDLLIKYGINDVIRIDDFATVGSVENITLSDGYSITDTQVNQIIQDMYAYANDNGIAFNSVDDVKDNSELMGVIASGWS